MDKETVKRLGVEHGLGMQVVDGDDWSYPNFIWFDSDMTKFAQACCDFQKEKDAQICEKVQAESELVLGADIEYKTGREMAACICALAIRNAKESPESDIDQATGGTCNG